MGKVRSNSARVKDGASTSGATFVSSDKGTDRSAEHFERAKDRLDVSRQRLDFAESLLGAVEAMISPPSFDGNNGDELLGVPAGEIVRELPVDERLALSVLAHLAHKAIKGANDEAGEACADITEGSTIAQRERDAYSTIGGRLFVENIDLKTAAKKSSRARRSK